MSNQVLRGVLSLFLLSIGCWGLIQDREIVSGNSYSQYINHARFREKSRKYEVFKRVWKVAICYCVQGKEIFSIYFSLMVMDLDHVGKKIIASVWETELIFSHINKHIPMKTELKKEIIEAKRAEILARWNAQQQRRNIFVNISEAKLNRAVRKELKEVL